MSRHRSQEEIIAEMLSITLKKAKKTHIMYKANLSYTLLTKYLDLLLEADLITYNVTEKIYQLTDRGATYLDRYAEYKDKENDLLSTESEFYDKKASLNKFFQE